MKNKNVLVTILAVLICLAVGISFAYIISNKATKNNDKENNEKDYVAAGNFKVILKNLKLVEKKTFADIELKELYEKHYGECD